MMNMRTDNTPAAEDDITQLRALLKIKPLPMTPAVAAQVLQMSAVELAEPNPWPAFNRALGLADVTWPLAAWTWQSLQHHLDYHPALKESLMQLAPILLIWSSRADGAWLQAQHPATQALDTLFFHLERWYPEVGPTDKLKPRLDQLLDTLAQITDEQSFIAAVEAFNHEADKDLLRAARLAERLQAAELGHIRTTAAQNRVNILFNQQVAERPLTEEVAEFITDNLLLALQFILINDPDNQQDWNFWSRILQSLIWSLAPEKSTEQIQAFYDRGPALVRQLENSPPPPGCDAEAYQRFVNTVSSQVITLLKGQQLDNITLPPRPVNESALLVEAVEVESRENWRSGDWVVFNAQGESEVRCQCLLQVPGTEQLLFVNRAGRKVLQKSRKQMDLSRETGIARPLANTSLFTTAQADANRKLFAWQAILHEDERATQEREQRENAEAHARLAAQRAEQLARERARIKAEAEATRLAAEQAERQRQQKEQAQHEAELAQMSEAETQINALTLGTWAELPDINGERVRAKLAVSMRSTGRYIFVDRVGSQVAEYRREQLIDLLLSGQVSFQQPERGFESRLEAIVRGLRKVE